jgi:hypothetical protein
MTQLDFTRIKKHFVHVSEKDPGILLSRSYRIWYEAILIGVLVVAAGATHAWYEFMHIEEGQVVVTDPVTTVRYRDVDINSALERYDARKAASLQYGNATTSVPRSIATPPPTTRIDVAPQVATSSPAGVQ